MQRLSGGGWIVLVASGLLLASFSISLALTSVQPCNSDADCVPNAKCLTSNVSGRSRCIGSDSLADPVPATSPLLNQSCSSNSSCPAGYRCAGLAVGQCAANPGTFCSFDSDCPGGACVGSCVASTSGCKTDADCVSGTCAFLNKGSISGICVNQSSCNADSPCPSGFSCTFQPQPGRCELAPTKCDADSDCLGNWHCHLSWATAGVITGECLPGD